MNIILTPAILLQYFEQANSTSAVLVKRIFPWKSESILKKEYLEKILF